MNLLMLSWTAAINIEWMGWIVAYRTNKFVLWSLRMHTIEYCDKLHQYATICRWVNKTDFLNFILYLLFSFMSLIKTHNSLQHCLLLFLKICRKTACIDALNAIGLVCSAKCIIRMEKYDYKHVLIIEYGSQLLMMMRLSETEIAIVCIELECLLLKLYAYRHNNDHNRSINRINKPCIYLLCIANKS